MFFLANEIFTNSPRSIRTCFKLRVMILAVEMPHTDESGSVRTMVEVAPKDDCIILTGTRAFMVCSSSEDAKRLVNLQRMNYLDLV